MKLNIYAWASVAIFLVLGYLFMVTALASLPYNTLSMDHNTKNMIYPVIPQGFGFFTRDPREPSTKVYQKEGEKWVLLNGANSRASNLFGLSRVSRRTNIEIGQLLTRLTNAAWEECKGSITGGCSPEDRCIADVITNPYDDPLVTGEFYLLTDDPVPWAWSKSLLNGADRSPSRPAHVLKIKVLAAGEEEVVSAL